MSGVRKLLQGKPIAYYPALARVLGGIAPALFFQQIAHWQGGREERWVFRTQEELEEELAMTPKVQATCRRHLLDGGFIEEERRAKNRLHYRPIWENVEAALQTFPSGNSRPTQAESLDHPNGRNSLNKSKKENKEVSTEGGASAKSVDEEKVESLANHTMKTIYQAMDSEGFKITGKRNGENEYGRQVARVQWALDNMAPTQAELEALPEAYLRAYKIRGPATDAVYALNELRRQAAREEVLASSAGPSSAASRKAGYEWLFDGENKEEERNLDAELKRLRDSA